MLDLNLRERLALERTVLANERTFLSYLRTAVAVAVVGGTILKFFPGPVFFIFSWMFISSALIIAMAGLKRYVKVAAIIRKVGLQQKFDMEAEINWFWHVVLVILTKLHLLKGQA